jgi:hypothetical protein
MDRYRDLPRLLAHQSRNPHPRSGQKTTRLEEFREIRDQSIESEDVGLLGGMEGNR